MKGENKQRGDIADKACARFLTIRPGIAQLIFILQ
jgi:hypothetical protein